MVSTEEKKALYDAYNSLMELASKTRQSNRAWDVRMLPIFTPKIPKSGQHPEHLEMVPHLTRKMLGPKNTQNIK